MLFRIWKERAISWVELVSDTNLFICRACCISRVYRFPRKQRLTILIRHFSVSVNRQTTRKYTPRSRFPRENSISVIRFCKYTFSGRRMCLLGIFSGWKGSSLPFPVRISLLTGKHDILTGGKATGNLILVSGLSFGQPVGHYGETCVQLLATMLFLNWKKKKEQWVLDARIGIVARLSKRA